MSAVVRAPMVAVEVVQAERAVKRELFSGEGFKAWNSNKEVNRKQQSKRKSKRRLLDCWRVMSKRGRAQTRTTMALGEEGGDGGCNGAVAG